MKDRQRQEPPPGIERSIRPDVPCPETVLVALMNDDSYLLMAYPQRAPAAFVTRDDAGPLRQALAAAFREHSDEQAAGGNYSGTPEYRTSDTKQIRP